MNIFVYDSFLLKIGESEGDGLYKFLDVFGHEEFVGVQSAF